MKHKKTNQNVKHRKTSHHRRKQNENRRHPESTLHLNRRIGADGAFRTGFLIPEETSNSAQEPITGIIEKHARGFAFLRREEGADIFIAPDNLGGAMNGDTAQVELLPPYLWTKSKEGIIVKILERATKEVVGTFQKKKGFGFVVPDDRKLTEDIYIKQDAFRSAANGDKVVAKITQYPDKQHRIEGKITEIVARKGETGSDVLSLIRGYGLFQTFPSRVNAEAKARGREKITDEEIARRLDLRGKNIFCEDFLAYLRDFEFKCDVWAVPEGTPIFPHEPIVTVRGPVMQAQFIETMVLLCINHQSMIATKASRIVRAAKGRPVMEFGSRRAHGADAAIMGARAAYIGGCSGTACAIADRDYGIVALGTMAHSWVQMYPDEYSAFKKYAEIYPDNCVLLVDTYNVLKSGVPAAIKVFKEMKPAKMGIRIDSGDVSYLTKQARKMLDEAGLEDCTIVVSNSLDEYIIRDVILEGAQINSFGVGERLITAKSEPVFGGVYKLAALEKNGVLTPKIKISENVEKITNPGFKGLYRLYSKDTGKARGDVITLAEETIPVQDSYEIFDPNAVWKKTRIRNYEVRNLHVPIFEQGKCVYESPDIETIKKYCQEQMETLWDETLRFENPQTYYVDLSQKLWDMKNRLLQEHAAE